MTGQSKMTSQTEMAREQAWYLIKRHGQQYPAFPELRVLKEQRSLVYKTINTIYTNIEYQDSDLRVCLPELRQAVHDILEAHSNSIQVQSTKLGSHHPVVRDLNQEHDQLVDDANTALRLCNTVLHHLDDLLDAGLVDNNTQPTEVSTKTVDTASTASSAIEAPAITTKPMAEDTIPAPTPMITRLLKQQRLEILEVIETVNDNIVQKRADLSVCIPELREIMCGLMEDHLGNARLLAAELGKDHTLVRKIVGQHLQLEDAVNGTLSHVNQMVMDSVEDWKEYSDVSRGIQDCVVPPHAPGPHAPGSNHSTQPMAMHSSPQYGASIAPHLVTPAQAQEAAAAQAVAPENNWSLGQHTPVSNCSIPSEAVYSSPHNGSSDAAHQLTTTQHQEDAAIQDAPGTAATKPAQDTASRKTRMEEMKTADSLLNQPDLDGDRVMMLVQKVTAVSGKAREEVTTSAFFDNGSTCSMITSSLARRLGLPTKKRVLVVQSFLKTQTIDSQVAIIELLREEGSLDQLRVYVVDEITTLGQVDVPEEIRLEYSETMPWPSERYSGEVEILIGMEELAIHPRLIELQGTLGVFKSSFSPMPILAGRHDRVFSAHTKFSQACHMIRTIPGAGDTQAMATTSQSQNSPVRLTDQFSAPSRQQITVCGSPDKGILGQMVSTDDNLSLCDQTPQAVDTTNHDAEVVIAALQTSDTTVSAAEGTYQSEGETMSLSAVKFPAVIRTAPITEAKQAVPETASDFITICDRVDKGTPCYMASSHNLQEGTISLRKYSLVGTVSEDQLMAPWPANSHLLPSSAKDNNTGAARYAADSTNLSQVQDPLTLASQGRQVHIFEDNLLLGQHSQGSSEDTSPPPHAGSTALSNYSAIAQPAGHQNQTADPQVQLQTQSEEPSETVQYVRVEPWTGKQLLTILMISAATMALIRQAGHPSSSLGSSFILEASKTTCTGDLRRANKQEPVSNSQDYPADILLWSTLRQRQRSSTGSWSPSSSGSSFSLEVSKVMLTVPVSTDSAKLLPSDPPVDASSQGNHGVHHLHQARGAAHTDLELIHYQHQSIHPENKTKEYRSENNGTSLMVPLHPAAMSYSSSATGPIMFSSKKDQENHHRDHKLSHSQEYHRIGQQHVRCKVKPRSPAKATVPMTTAAAASSPASSLVTAGNKIVPQSIGHAYCIQHQQSLAQHQEHEQPLQQPRDDQDLLHDDPPQQNPGRDTLQCQLSGNAQREHNQESRQVLQQSGHQPQHQQVPPGHSQHHPPAVIEQAGRSQGSSPTNMTIMMDKYRRKLVMIGTHQSNLPVLDQAQPVHVVDNTASKEVSAGQEDSKEPGAVSGITEVGTNQQIDADLSVKTVVNKEEVNATATVGCWDQMDIPTLPLGQSYGGNGQSLLLCQALLAIDTSHALTNGHLSLQEVALHGTQDALALHLQQITLVHQATPVVQRNKSLDNQVHRPRISSLLAIYYGELLPNQHPDGIQQVRDTRNILLQQSCVSNSHVRHLRATHAVPHQPPPLGHHQSNLRQLQHEGQPINPQHKPPYPGQVVQHEFSPGHSRPSKYHAEIRLLPRFSHIHLQRKPAVRLLWEPQCLLCNCSSNGLRWKGYTHSVVFGTALL